MNKKAAGLILVLLALSTVVHAQSEFIDPLKGQWDVTLQNGSTVTWDIQDNVYVSGSGRSHIGYGLSNPGNVEFEIFYSKDIPGGKYCYIEKPWADVPDYNGLPSDLTEYTLFAPTPADAATFTCFIADAVGKYPIKSGARDGATCDNTECTLQKIIPAQIGKVMALASPLMPFVIIGDADFAKSDKASFDSEAIVPVIKGLHVGKRIVLAICRVRPFQLVTGEVKVAVGSCTGTITVK